MTTTTKQLTGEELLAYNKANYPKLTKAELVLGAGYIKTKRNGSEGPSFTAYYTALLEAQEAQEEGKEPNPFEDKDLFSVLQENGITQVEVRYYSGSSFEVLNLPEEVEENQELTDFILEELQTLLFDAYGSCCNLEGYVECLSDGFAFKGSIQSWRDVNEAL